MHLNTPYLSAENICDLANGKLLAISVKKFISVEMAKLLSEKLLKDGYDHYINAPSIGRIGMAFYEAENKPDLLARYFDVSNKNISELRSRCTPYASPIDTFRCYLEEIWPAGAHLETLYGKKCSLVFRELLSQMYIFLLITIILRRMPLTHFTPILWKRNLPVTSM